MLLPETECSGVITVVERLRSRLMSAIPTERGDVRITASFGAAVNQRIRTTDVETLITCADQALLYAKQQGKNRLVIWCDTCDSASHCPHIAPHMLPHRVSTIFLSPGKPDESA